ncbi:hypothetical protein RchiOBHm_Chr2g0133951 [Rosa chinensis]|uniref:Uncharacterized protein n=1 Tax=Rosa chinensis TaxID=74649 RepID=A0A2P6RVP8_ROSCH|nr:hypothetical protein RchiOBHm_Chr2g0133951 [Rosa chinensis]
MAHLIAIETLRVRHWPIRCNPSRCSCSPSWCLLISSLSLPESTSIPRCFTAPRSCLSLSLEIPLSRFVFLESQVLLLNGHSLNENELYCLQFQNSDIAPD